MAAMNSQLPWLIEWISILTAAAWFADVRKRQSREYLAAKGREHHDSACQPVQQRMVAQVSILSHFLVFFSYGFYWFLGSFIEFETKIV